ncbi:MAG: MarR family winged helix-turn-helix transcriptional regulator [Desulfobacterales bacterium]|nr:MarR family winged helix-turn-helix transcriptional regulator [Desulfobacterales bacterium]
MAKSIEMILAEMSLRVRLLMSAENAGKRIAGLSERETLLLELIGTKKELCISEIAEFFGGVSSSTISMTITKLWRKHKLVDKKIMPRNQRVTMVSLTDKGQQLLAEIKKDQLMIYKTVTESLGLAQEQDENLRKLLKNSIRFFDKQLGLNKRNPHCK